jgi:hypothetical protein
MLSPVRRMMLLAKRAIIGAMMSIPKPMLLELTFYPQPNK